MKTIVLAIVLVKFDNKWSLCYDNYSFNKSESVMKYTIVLLSVILMTGCASLDDRTNQRLGQSIVRSLSK